MCFISAKQDICGIVLMTDKKYVSQWWANVSFSDSLMKMKKKGNYNIKEYSNIHVKHGMFEFTMFEAL